MESVKPPSKVSLGTSEENLKSKKLNEITDLRPLKLNTKRGKSLMWRKAH
jgi:hypothetical protein